MVESAARRAQRKTRQRQLILEVLRSTDSHPTADWIYEQARKKMPKISLGTVYRNLNLLRDLGEIIELNFGSTFSRFDGNPLPHYHFTCLKCGRVYDVDEPLHPELEERVERSMGCEVTNHRLEFYGTCRECLRREKQQ